MIPLFDIKVNDYSKKLVKEVLDSGYLNEGKYVQLFEEKLSEREILNPSTTNSCTTALQIALELSNVKGREVIIPSQSFIATGLAVLIAGGIPVFADILPNGNIDIEDVKKCLTDETAAIIAVHWGGIPCDIHGLNDLVKGTNIKVIEDAAHAFGAYAKGKVIGSISDYTCFSFQSIKSVCTGDGGAICHKNSDDWDRIEKLKWFGMNRHNITKSTFGYRLPFVENVGYKAHMNDIAAALGLGSLSDFDDRLFKRCMHALLYIVEFKNVSGIQLIDYKPYHGDLSTFWLFTMHVENKYSFIKMMESAGISTSMVDVGMNFHPVFREFTKRRPALAGQLKFHDTAICIPVHEYLTTEQRDHIINTIKGGW